MRITYNTFEAAELLGISRAFLYTLVNTGAIKTIKAGRRRLISHKELERWANEQIA